MNLLGTLENGLFALAQVLRFPVIVLLWISVAAAVFMVGGCVVEFLARRRERAGFDLNAWLDHGTLLGADDARQALLPTGLAALLRDVKAERGKAGKVAQTERDLGELETQIRDLERQRADEVVAAREKQLTALRPKKLKAVKRLAAALDAAAEANAQLRNIDERELAIRGQQVDPTYWFELTPETPAIESKIGSWRRRMRERGLL